MDPVLAAILVYSAQVAVVVAAAGTAEALARIASPGVRLAWWRIVANFFRYLQIAERRKPAASPIAKAELRSGDGISGHEIAAIEERQLLVACADHDLVASVWRRTRRNE